ncbi:hypothetical protein IWQ61_004927 [Dispira simplex]|nr:hypothetical protein IWQ61_004927 [Dispira simplex]
MKVPHRSLSTTKEANADTVGSGLPSPVMAYPTDAEKQVMAWMEQRSIPDMRRMVYTLTQKRTQKQIQLRQVVGKEYRQVVAAADSVVHINNNVQAMLTDTERMRRLVGDQLQQRSGLLRVSDHKKPQALVGEPSINYLVTRRDGSSDPSVYFTLAAQLKILLEIPGLLWRALDRNYLIQAAVLYQFADKVYQTFRNTKDDGSTSPLQNEHDLKRLTAEQFPLAHRQWDIIRPFSDKIVEQCQRVLSLPRLDCWASNGQFSCQHHSATPEGDPQGKFGPPPCRAVQALVALILLESNSLDQLADTFLSYRQAWLAGSLADNHNGGSNTIGSYPDTSAVESTGLTHVVNPVLQGVVDTLKDTALLFSDDPVVSVCWGITHRVGAPASRPTRSQSVSFSNFTSRSSPRTDVSQSSQCVVSYLVHQLEQYSVPSPGETASSNGREILRRNSMRLRSGSVRSSQLANQGLPQQVSPPGVLGESIYKVMFPNLTQDYRTSGLSLFALTQLSLSVGETNWMGSHINSAQPTSSAHGGTHSNRGVNTHFTVPSAGQALLYNHLPWDLFYFEPVPRLRSGPNTGQDFTKSVGGIDKTISLWLDSLFSKVIFPQLRLRLASFGNDQPVNRQFGDLCFTLVTDKGVPLRKPTTAVPTCVTSWLGRFLWHTTSSDHIPQPTQDIRSLQGLLYLVHLHPLVQEQVASMLQSQLRNLVYEWPLQLVHDAVSDHLSSSNDNTSPIGSPTGSVASPGQTRRSAEGYLISGSAAHLTNTYTTKLTTRTYPKLADLQTDLRDTTEAIQLLSMTRYHSWVHKAEEMIRGLVTWLRHYHRFNRHTCHRVSPILDNQKTAASPAVALVTGYSNQLEALLDKVPIHSDTTRVTRAFQAYLTEETCSADFLSQPTWRSIPKDVLEDLSWANVCQGLFRIDTILVNACRRPLVSKAVFSTDISRLAKARQHLKRKHQSCYLSYIDWLVGSCLGYWHRHAVQIYSKFPKGGPSGTADMEWKQQLIGGTMVPVSSWQNYSGTDPASITTSSDSKASTAAADLDGQRCTASAAALGVIYQWLQLLNLAGGYLQLPSDVQHTMVERMRTALVGWFSVLLGLTSGTITTLPTENYTPPPLTADQTMVAECNDTFTLGEHHPSSLARQIFTDWVLLSRYFKSSSSKVAEDDTVVPPASQVKAVEEWAMRVEMTLLEKASLSDSSDVSHVVTQMALDAQSMLQNMKCFVATPLT